MPFMLVEAPLLVFARAFEFAFVFDMFAFDMFAFVLVLSAGEHAAPAPATVSRARRAKVLRIEFPPEPSEVG